MSYEKPKYEFPIDWRDWCTGAGQPASILWLAGRSWLTGIGSPAEQALLASGAVPVGTLRFDRDPVEGVLPNATVDRVSARGMLRYLEAT
jgi:hypothetical protein